MNAKKTECMTASRTKQPPKCNIECHREQIKQVNKFKYLGFMLTSNGRCITEVKRRIAIAKDAFNK